MDTHTFFTLMLLSVSFVTACSDDMECSDDLEYDPQCSSDDETYSNVCTFNIAKCKQMSLEIAYKGQCSPSQDTDIACGEDVVCTQQYEPLCGSDGETYSNECTFNVAKCDEVSLQVAYKGECKPSHEHPCDHLEVCTKEFSPQCGSDGRTYSNSCQLKAAICREPSLHLSYEGQCKLSTLKATEKEHHHSSVKPGFCPVINPGQVGRCVNECLLDSECNGANKCCDNGCASVCLPARVSKPGVCPVALSDPDCASPEPESATCDSDVDCEGATKCCFNGCQSVCVDPQERGGFCPAVPTSEPEPSPAEQPVTARFRRSAGICVNNCTHDHECQFPKKCCHNGCGFTCIDPEIPKEGLCAPVSEEESLGGCVEMCSRDSECRDDLKCCSNGCGHTCQDPEIGTCEKDFKKYHNGETKLDVNNCDECTCINGTLECTERDCFCEFLGKKHASGDSFSAKDGCNKCHCFGLKVICTDFVCYDDKDSSKRVLGIVLGCIFGILFAILVVALVVVLVSKNKKDKKEKKPKSSKGESHSPEEAEALPAKV